MEEGLDEVAEGDIRLERDRVDVAEEVDLERRQGDFTSEISIQS